ncbi:MAG: hypothetical protein FWE16_03260 [Firmicutes bacterium]|nr:hypothetical protein [Bacillota bacterium]
MILGSFDNMLKTISNDQQQMSFGNNFNVVRELMNIVSQVQHFAHSIQSSSVNDMLSMNLSGKLQEIESIITTFGMQRLMANGINTGGMQQNAPFMPNNPMHNQNFYYPSMGMGMPNMQMQQPQMMQPQPPQMQQAAPPSPPVPQPPVQAPPSTPPPAPTPQPLMQDTSGDVAPAPSSSGGGSSGPASSFTLPGLGGGGGDDKPAPGRDYLLKLLSDG